MWDSRDWLSIWLTQHAQHVASYVVIFGCESVSILSYVLVASRLQSQLMYATYK